MSYSNNSSWTLEIWDFIVYSKYWLIYKSFLHGVSALVYEEPWTFQDILRPLFFSINCPHIIQNFCDSTCRFINSSHFGTLALVIKPAFSISASQFVSDSWQGMQFSLCTLSRVKVHNFSKICQLDGLFLLFEKSPWKETGYQWYTCMCMHVCFSFSIILWISLFAVF